MAGSFMTRELLHSFLASDGYTVRSFESGDALLALFYYAGYFL